MLKGRVIKGYSSFYYVKAEDEIYECKLRGKLKLSYNSVFVGDKVVFDAKNGKGVIKDILPRANQLVRPPIANIDLGLTVFSLASPDPVPELIDRVLLAFEYADIKPVIVFTKQDLIKDEDMSIVETYRSIGYEVMTTSIGQKTGLEEIRRKIAGRISVVAGPSGVGKSTLLNAIQAGFALKTGEVSSKIGRGKHTTRHVELLPLSEGGYIADTPGFSVLYLPDMKPVDLADYYREFQDLKRGCKFTGCLHKSEPECAVKEALAEGKIDAGRYKRYLVFLEQLIEKEKKMYD